MVSEHRAQRIADRIQEELAKLLLFEVTDPRLGGVSVTEVRVDRELAYANIFVSALEGSERKDEILAGCEHAKGYLRHQLAKRVDLRRFPRLRFHWDPTPEQAARIDELIASMPDTSTREEESEQDG